MDGSFSFSRLGKSCPVYSLFRTSTGHKTNSYAFTIVRIIVSEVCKGRLRITYCVEFEKVIDNVDGRQR